MPNNGLNHLQSLPARHGFLIGVDSDGCAFDSMEIKHKECFIPNIINSWDLQAVSRFAREASEFVNLYSRWRGTNRFPALVLTFDLLSEHPQALARGYQSPQVDSLRRWVKEETRLSSAALAEQVAATGDPVLRRAMEWSDAVNETVERIVRGVPPFPFVRESLAKLQDSADVLVVSATPTEALQREWEEHDIAGYVRAIGGQEMGSKAELLQHASQGKYPPGHVLMVGDAPGDLKAARTAGALFYPINPGDEARSWERFHSDAADRFLHGEYAGEYEQKLIDAFLALLPETPPWK